jgi:hypothetical protein
MDPQLILVAAVAFGLYVGGVEAWKGMKYIGRKAAAITHIHKNKPGSGQDAPRVTRQDAP